jgi:hypothetical protein
MPDRKKIAALIVAKLKPGSGEDMPEEDGEEEDIGEDEKYSVGAKAVRKALESKDDEALAEALRSFVSMCSD